MDKTKVRDEVKEIFRNLFQTKEGEWQDSYDTEDFFGSKIGLLPGDVLAFLYAVERQFGFQVSPSDIQMGRFHTLSHVTDIVYKALCHESEY